MRKNEYSQDNCVVLAVTYRFVSSENGNEIGGIIIPLTPLNVKMVPKRRLELPLGNPN